MTIAPIPCEHWTAALELLFGHLPDDERQPQVEGFRARLASGEVPAAGLLGAWRDGQLTGAILGQVQPGRTANVWLPRLTADEPSDTAAALLGAACRQFDAAGVVVAQAMPENPSEAETALLLRLGFEFLTDLLYLVCQHEQLPADAPPSALEFEPFEPAAEARLARVVAATYQQSLDCPALNGVRAMGDVLAGYRATGRFEPRLWQLARRGGEDVGCLLLADHPPLDAVELVDMGVLPAARGSGLGGQLTRQAQWLTRCQGRGRLLLAVDERNAPAIRAYAAAGFQAWQRRRVFVRMGKA